MQLAVQRFNTLMACKDFAGAEQISLESQVGLQGRELAEWVLRLAHVHWLRGRCTESLQYFDEAISLDPFFTEAMFASSVLLSDLGFYEEARLRFESATSLENVNFVISKKLLPINEAGSIEYLTLLEKLQELTLKEADIYSDMGLWREALEALLLAKKRYPTEKILIKLALFYLKDRRVSVALEELQAAKKINPKSQDVAVLIGVCLLLQRKSLQAYQTLAELGFLSDPSPLAKIVQQVATQGF